MSVKRGDAETKIALVSDGEKLALIGDKVGPKRPIPKWVNDANRVSLPRSSLVVPLMLIPRVGEQTK
jgi:hypothetical protein